MPSTTTPRLLPGSDISPAVPVVNKLADGAKPASKTTVHFAVPIGDPGETTVSRICGGTLDKMLRPNSHITSIQLSGKTQFGSGVPVSAQQLSTNVGVVVARRHPTDPTGSERIPTIGDTHRQFAATHFENGVGVLGAHMHVNGAETRATTLHCKRPTELSDEDLATMTARYPENVLNLSPADILAAHEPHKRMTPDPKTGAQRAGYVIPIVDDGTSKGPTPMHAFLTSRGPSDPALANKITILGKDHAVYQEGDFHTIASGLSANTKHDDITRGVNGSGRELMFQIKNPEHSHIESGDAVALVTATIHTNGASADTGGDDGGVPAAVDPLEAEMNQAINAKLGGGYKNVFNPDDHIPVATVAVPAGAAAPAGLSGAPGASSAPGGQDSDDEE